MLLFLCYWMLTENLKIWALNLYRNPLDKIILDLQDCVESFIKKNIIEDQPSYIMSKFPCSYKVIYLGAILDKKLN